MDNHKEAARRACIIVDQSMLMPGEKEAITKFIREQQQQLAAATAALAAEREGRETRPVLYWREKAERAEAKLKYEKESSDALFVLNESILRKAEQAEAQCAAMLRREIEQYEAVETVCDGQSHFGRITKSIPLIRKST